MGNENSQNNKNTNSNSKHTTNSIQTSQSAPSANVKRDCDGNKNKSMDDQKHQTIENKSIGVTPEYEYVDDKIVTMNTPEYKFQIGDKIDGRDKNGTWRECTILDIIKSESGKNIYGFLQLGYNNHINTNIMKIKIKVTPLNICLCTQYCFKYNRTQLKWSNHMVAAPNTQSKKWLYNYPQNVIKLNDTDNTQPLHYKFTLIVFGFMRLNYEQLYNKEVPMDIKQIIYIYWEYWTQLTGTDGLRIKDDDGIWKGAVVRGKVTMNRNMRRLHLMYAFCPNILKVRDRIDAKDRDEKWYLAEIIAIKRAKKKFPMNPPSKKKKLKKFAAIYVHFIEFGDRFNEWISMKNGVMCSCSTGCSQSDHRITFAKTQSDNNPKSREVLYITENSFCDCCDDKCEESNHRLKYTENYKLIRSSDMLCFC